LSREEGRPARVEEWAPRKSNVFRRETLEIHGCADEYMYLKNFMP